MQVGRIVRTRTMLDTLDTSTNMMRTLRTFLLLLSILHYSHGQVIDTGEIQGECRGAVTLYEGSEETIVTKDEDDIKVSVDRVKMEGCGCFTLHAKKSGRGKSFFLGKSGEFSGDQLGLRRVRSVRRVSCERRAMPMWSVILLVVGLIIVTGVVAVCGFRKYREYTRVKTGESSIEST